MFVSDREDNVRAVSVPTPRTEIKGASSSFRVAAACCNFCVVRGYVVGHLFDLINERRQRRAQVIRKLITTDRGERFAGASWQSITHRLCDAARCVDQQRACSHQVLRVLG